MPKKTLTDQGKEFVVKSLAVYDSPSDIAVAVKEKFSVTISKQGVQHYDPTKVAGEDLDPKLKELFFDQRKQFEESEILPLSKKIVRIKKLSKYVENAENLGNDIAAAGYIEQIAKEEGGMFTNRKEISGPGGKPVEIHSKTLEEWKNDAQTRTNQAASVLDLFDNAS